MTSGVGHLTPISRIAGLPLGEMVGKGRANPIAVLVSGTLLLGIPLWLLFCVGFFQSAPPMPDWKLIHWAVFFASSWILISPALVAQWELCALSGALARLREFAAAQNIDLALVERIRRSWPLSYLLSGILFAAFANFCFVVYRAYLSDAFLILDGTPAFYLTLTILTITGFITGIGVGGVVFSLWMLGRVMCERLEWQPFHADQRGGYGFLANFSLETAVLFSFGSVIVPAAVTIGYRVGWPINLAIYGFTVFYALLIVLIFAWPVTSLALNADRCRQRYLADYSDGIAFAIANSRNLKSNDSGHITLEAVEHAATHILPAERLIYMFEKIAGRSILPFRTTLLVRIVTAGLTPLILMLVQLYLERSFSQ